MTDQPAPTKPPTIYGGDLVSEIADKTDLKPGQIKEAISALTDTIGAHLQQGHRVQLGDLGTFEAKPRAERYATNPQTRQKITIPETIAPTFRPAQALKNRVKPNQTTAPIQAARTSIRAGANRNRGGER